MSRTGNLFVEYDDLVCVVWCHMISLSLLILCSFCIRLLCSAKRPRLVSCFLFPLCPPEITFVLCILLLFSHESCFMVSGQYIFRSTLFL